MLKVRVIPTLLWKDVGLVKGVSFDSWRRVGTVLPAIKVYNTREVDELILLDITATEQGREPDYDSIADFASECFVPLTFGGGLKSFESIRNVLKAGADKVALNTVCFENPEFIQGASDRFGAQCLVASLDVRKHSSGRYECYSHSGRKPTGREVVSFAKELEELGVGEILLTSIERDGMMQGYDLELIRLVSEAVKIPVIAAGGAGNYQHFSEAILYGKASAVAAASIFHFTEQTPLEAKKFLARSGIPVRNSSQSSSGLVVRSPQAAAPRVSSQMD